MVDLTDCHHINYQELWERRRQRVHEQEEEQAREREREQARERQLQRLHRLWLNHQLVRNRQQAEE